MKPILLLLLLFVSTFAIKINRTHQQVGTSPMVGAYSTTDVDNLSDDMKQIDNYLKTTFP